MNISEILEQMEDVMESAWSMPLTGGKSVVDVGQLKDLIHDIRANLPEEIRQAQALMENRQKVLDEAKQEADRIIRQAQAQAQASKLYQDPITWNRMSLYNIAGAGVFSADRAIRDYATTIWDL